MTGNGLYYLSIRIYGGFGDGLNNLIIDIGWLTSFPTMGYQTVIIIPNQLDNVGNTIINTSPTKSPFWCDELSPNGRFYGIGFITLMGLNGDITQLYLFVYLSYNPRLGPQAKILGLRPKIELEEPQHQNVYESYPVCPFGCPAHATY